MAKIETTKQSVTFKVELTLNEMATIAAALAVPSETIRRHGSIAGVDALMLNNRDEYTLFSKVHDAVIENK